MAIVKGDIYRCLGWNVQGDIGPLTLYTSKRRGLVYFPKSPPDKPASYAQLVQRNRFRLAALAWTKCTPDQRATWSHAALAARVQATGWNLFTYYQLTRNAPPIHTIERLSGETLLPVE